MADVVELGHRLAAGKLSLTRWAAMSLDRLEELDPRLQAFVPELDRRERVLAAASAAGRRWPSLADRPALFGLTIAVEDVFRVAGLPMRQGVTLPSTLFAGAESPLVAKLLDAGALVLGKAQTPPLGLPLAGPTHHPLRPELPAGSGAAAAVAAGLAPLGLGREVAVPAAWCGVPAFAPSAGRLAEPAGCYAGELAGLALMAAVLIEGWDAAVSVRRPVLGVPDVLARVPAEVRAVFGRQLEFLAARGYVVRRVAFWPEAPMAEALEVLRTAALAEAHAPVFDAHETYYPPEAAAAIRRGLALTPAQLAGAREVQARMWDALHGRMAEAAIDLWLAPAAAGAAGAGAVTAAWRLAGLPAVVLPAGRGADGLPLGLQLVGPHLDDERLLAWARDLATALA